ncbi:serine hydrolase [Arthrobacter pigmenti]
MPVISAYSPGDPTIGFCLLDHAGHILAERGSEQKYYAASTIKLAVLLAVMRRIDAGEHSLDDKVTARNRFTSAYPGSGEYSFDADEVDPRFPSPGTSMRLADVLDVMITRSSNEATNIAVELIGLDAINATIADCSLAVTEMNRLIGDLPARDAGYTISTSAADLARLMRFIATGELTTPSATQFMLSALHRQELCSIARALPAGTQWGSKSGSVPGVIHDAAFIGSPGTDETLYLAVCTRGYEEDQGREAIIALTSALASPTPTGAMPYE